MIKRLRFVTRHATLPVHEFAPMWVAAVALIRNAPSAVRPVRTVACTTLHHVAGTEAPHDGIRIDWFADVDALRRFEAWLGSDGGQRATRVPSLLEPTQTMVLVAQELVMRGADWLAQRWTSQALKLKHMALARRALGLTSAEFSERWRKRPGTIGNAGATAAITIPEAARGHAYVQNHPIAAASLQWAYDAVNEVYFDDLESMQKRIEFFREHDVGRAEAELVSEARFVAVREHLL
jgi:hypothetical protein